MVSIIRAIVFFIFMVYVSWAASAWEVFGIGHLEDHSELNHKFKSEGDAVFLIKNMQRGISKGDIIRFENKAIFIDDEVWEFLRNLNILSQIKQAPLQISRASARSNIWSQHARNKKNSTTKKSYQFGAELLKVMEKYFGAKPASSEFHIKFHQGKMIFTADKKFLQNLNYQTVQIQNPIGPPQIISAAPDTAIYIGEKLEWQAWAIAPGIPSENLTYKLKGKMPPDIKWDPKNHKLTGQFNTSGNWKFQLIVSNTKGQSDSLNFKILSRSNTPPKFGSLPADTIYTRESYKYKPNYYDQDHANEELTFRYESSHPNFTYNKHTQKFFIEPEDDMDGETIQVDMMVYDPMGDTSWLSRKIHVVSYLKKIQTQNLSTSIPFDTLVANHHYAWNISPALKEIKAQQMRVIQVKGPDSLWFKKRTIHFLPKRPGNYSVEFQIKAGKDTILFNKEFFVIPNQNPNFISSLDKNIFEQDEDIVHQVVAIDPENDPVSIQVNYFSDSTSFSFQNHQLKLNTENPGRYLIELKATDSTGASSFQILTWQVNEIRKDWYGGQYQYLNMGELEFHQLAYENAMGRFGLSTSQANRIFGKNQPYQTFPFLFAGLNLTNTEKVRRGDYFFVDLGISFKKPHKKLITGGVYSGMTTRTHYFDDQWISEIDFKLISNQVILLLDTNDLLPQKVTLDEVLELVEGTSDHLVQDQKDAIRQYQTDGNGAELKEVAKLLSEEYGDPNNVKLYFRLENLIPIQPWLLIGPSQLLQYYHLYNDLHLSNGAIARHWIQGKHYRLEQNFRLHYAPQVKYQFGYEIRISLGKWSN